MKSNKIFVKHNLDTGQLDHCFSGLRQKLVVDGQPSEVLQPGESPFDNPSFQEDLELTGTFIGAKHDFNDPAELSSHPVTKGALVPAICKYLTEARELVFKFLDNLRAPLLSCRLASWTATAIGRPSVSTTMCSLRPLIFLFPSIPLSEST